VTGGKKWEFSTGWFVSSSPVIANGLLYVGCWDKNFYALDAATKTVKWKFSDVQVDGAPIVVENGKVIGSYPSNSGVIN
jgi:outer membrane protein assembly factor BamB